MSAHLIELQWPLFIIRAPPHIDESIANEMLAHFELLFAQKNVYGLVTDLRGVKMPNAQVRKILMEYQKQNADLFKRYVAADAMVISNRIERGLVTAINWFAPTPQPQGFFPTLEKAIAWAEEQTRPLV